MIEENIWDYLTNGAEANSTYLLEVHIHRLGGPRLILGRALYPENREHTTAILEDVFNEIMRDFPPESDQ